MTILRPEQEHPSFAHVVSSPLVKLAFSPSLSLELEPEGLKVKEIKTKDMKDRENWAICCPATERLFTLKLKDFIMHLLTQDQLIHLKFLHVAIKTNL